MDTNDPREAHAQALDQMARGWGLEPPGGSPGPPPKASVDALRAGAAALRGQALIYAVADSLGAAVIALEHGHIDHAHLVTVVKAEVLRLEGVTR